MTYQQNIGKTSTEWGVFWIYIAQFEEGYWQPKGYSLLKLSYKRARGRGLLQMFKRLNIFIFIFQACWYFLIFSIIFPDVVDKFLFGPSVICSPTPCVQHLFIVWFINSLVHELLLFNDFVLRRFEIHRMVKVQYEACFSKKCYFLRTCFHEWGF